MKIGDYNFTFGADPEFFVQKKGKPVSAFGLVMGTKDRPFPVKGGAVQVDGMALEFNIDPAENPEGFSRNLDIVLKQIMEMVPGHDIYDKPVAHFGKEYIDAQPKEAKELGCNPDYNAYTGAANPKPDGGLGFRTAAGHLHIGWTHGVDPKDPGHFNACRRLVRQLDRYLGVPSLFWDKDDQRRKLYGQAGAFRPTHFGVEYRVLSNAWLLNEKGDHYLRRYVVNQASLAIKELFENPEAADLPIMGKKASDIIATADTETAALAYTYGGFQSPAAYFKSEVK